MSVKGLVLQIVILVISITIFVALVVAPKKYSVSKLHQQQTKETKADIQAQITEVKNSMKKTELAVINGFEMKFGSSSGPEKIQWLDSIIVFWDKNMRPAVSAVYAKDKAELSGKMDDYMMAGQRFMQVGEFLKPEDKPWAYDEAKQIYIKILQTNPENIDAQIDLASCWMMAPDPQNPMQGVLMLKDIVAKDSTNTRAILQLGHFSVLSGQFSKAIERFQQALKIDPKLDEAYFYIGDTYAKMGDMENAEKYLLQYRGLLKDEEVKIQLDIYLEDLKKMSNTKMN